MNSKKWSRREVLKVLPLSTGAAMVWPHWLRGSVQPPIGSKEQGSANPLAGIEPQEVVKTYRDRGLGRLSDAELYWAVAAIVARPDARLTQKTTSFVLHAPLELMARYSLLPSLTATNRELARLQMVASAAFYAAGTRPLPDLEVEPAFSKRVEAKAAWHAASRSGNADLAEATAMRFGRQFGLLPLVAELTPGILVTKNGACHGHIGLWQSLTHGFRQSPDQLLLLRAAVRLMADNPDGTLQSFNAMALQAGPELKKTPEQLGKAVTERLLDLPTWQGSRPGGIRGSLRAFEPKNLVEDVFGDVVHHRLTAEQVGAAFKALLRVCALTMIQDTPRRAQFEWTHSLTLSQAAFGLATMGFAPRLCLAAALVWTTNFRHCFGTLRPEPGWEPKRFSGSLEKALISSPREAAAKVWHAGREDYVGMAREMANVVAVRNDQHLVKYTRTCFDMMVADHEYDRLYLAAAAYFCARWLPRTPHEELLENLGQGRKTPS